MIQLDRRDPKELLSAKERKHGRQLTTYEEVVLLAIILNLNKASRKEIRETLESTESSVTRCSLYIVLLRLEVSGYIVHSLGEASSHKGPKLIDRFSVTDFGRDALNKIKGVRDALTKVKKS